MGNRPLPAPTPHRESTGLTSEPPLVKAGQGRTPAELRREAILGVLCLLLWCGMVAGIMIRLGVGW